MIYCFSKIDHCLVDLIVYVEYVDHLCENYQILNVVADACKLDRSSILHIGRMRSDDCADAGAVDIIDLRQIDDQALVTLLYEIRHRLAESIRIAVADERSFNVDDRDPAVLNGPGFNRHLSPSWRSSRL